MASLIFIVVVIGATLILWRSGGTMHGRASQRLAILMFAGLVVVTVLLPDTTTTVANWIGIGRGADLVTYLTAFGLMFLAAVSYIKSKTVEERLARLVSELATVEALEDWDSRGEG